MNWSGGCRAQATGPRRGGGHHAGAAHHAASASSAQHASLGTVSRDVQALEDVVHVLVRQPSSSGSRHREEASSAAASERKRRRQSRDTDDDDGLKTPAGAGASASGMPPPSTVLPAAVMPPPPNNHSPAAPAASTITPTSGNAAAGTARTRSPPSAGGRSRQSSLTPTGANMDTVDAIRSMLEDHHRAYMTKLNVISNTMELVLGKLERVMQQADSLHPAHVSRIVGHRRHAADVDTAPKTAAPPVPVAVAGVSDDHRDRQHDDNDAAQDRDDVVNTMSLLHGTFAVADVHDTSLDRLNSAASATEETGGLSPWLVPDVAAPVTAPVSVATAAESRSSGSLASAGVAATESAGSRPHSGDLLDVMASPPAQLDLVLMEFDPFAPAPAPAPQRAPSPPTQSEPPALPAPEPVHAPAAPSAAAAPVVVVAESAAARPTSTVLDRAVSRDVSGLPTEGSGGYEPDAAGTGPVSAQSRFSYARFLEQWKRPEAANLNLLVKKFATEQLTKPLSVDRQSEEVQDFLLAMADEMGKNVLWRETNDVEFDHALEGLEKFVMNKLHDRLFSPLTADDEQRDDVLRRKLALLRWVREEHLDIKATEHNDVYVRNAADELLKINKYKAPRDKIICILNCCKIIYILLRKSGNEAGADSFLPLLILVIIRANPPKLVSNIQYISRFRGQNRLRSEAGYYFTNVVGAITFIESMDKNSLTVSQEDFDRNVEIALREFEEEEDRIAAEARAAAAAAVSAAPAPATGAPPTPGPVTALAPAPAPSAGGIRPPAPVTLAVAVAPTAAPTSATAEASASRPSAAAGKAAPATGSVAAPASGLTAVLPSFSLATLSQHLFGTVTGSASTTTGSTPAAGSAGSRPAGAAPPSRPPAMPPRSSSGVPLASGPAVGSPQPPVRPPAAVTPAAAVPSGRPPVLPTRPTAAAPMPAPVHAPIATTFMRPPAPVDVPHHPTGPPRRTEEELQEEYEVQLAMALSLSVKEAEMQGIPIPPDTPVPAPTSPSIASPASDADAAPGHFTDQNG